MSMTYSDLYTLVSNEIQKNIAFGSSTLTGSDALSRSQVVGGINQAAITNSVATNTASIVASIMDLMMHTVPPQIKSGLHVKATSPVSNYITIAAGEGTVGSKIFKLSEDTTYHVNFDGTTAVWYINFGTDGINMSKAPIFGKLTIAKVVVPKPGVTAFIRDDRDVNNNPWDAWIVNYREYKLFGNDAGKLEEDSIQLLKDNIGDILADTLIGNIRLSEDLKITNTQGSVELDSQGINIYDTNENKMAIFNRYGTFFYDTNGIELAKFSVDGARIGNISITKNSMQSTNFVSGVNGKGFQINDNGDATFENALIRGEIKSAVFKQDEIQISNGDIIVTTGTLLNADIDDSTSTVTVKEAVFADNDIIVLRKANKREFMKVLSGGLTTTLTVTRNFDGASGTTPSSWTKGDVIGRCGDRINIVSNGDFEENTPYIDVIDRTSQTNLADECTRVRMGNLAGITDADFGTLSGYGLYGENVYLRGNIQITGGNASVTFYQEVEPGSSGDSNTPKDGDFWVKTSTSDTYVYDSGTWILAGPTITDSNGKLCVAAAPTGCGLFLGSSYMGYYDDNPPSGQNAGWQSYMSNDGSFQFGSADGHKIIWDGNSLCIDACLSASCISAGTIYASDGIAIHTGYDESGGYNAATVFNSDGIHSYNAEGDTLFLLSCGCITAKSIRLEDPLCTCNYSFLDGGALKFHDSLGDVPYVKRICSGIGATGETIVLNGWTSPPEVITGINRLTSYDAACNGVSQVFDASSTTPVWYCTSPTCYGYCFDICGSLTTEGSLCSVCITSKAFDTCAVTYGSVCRTCIGMTFLMYCNPVGDACYSVGCVAYEICYKCNGCASWQGSCSFTYQQDSSSSATITSASTVYNQMNLPSAECWVLMATEVSSCWVPTTVSSGSVEYCVCTRNIPQCNAVSYSCDNDAGPHNYPVSSSDSIAIAGSNPSNVYCNILCHCVCDVDATCENENIYCLKAGLGYSAEAYGCVYVCGTPILGCCTNWNIFNCTAPQGAAVGWDSIGQTDIGQTSTNLTSITLCTYACFRSKDDVFNPNNHCGCACGEITWAGGCLIQCYCNPIGGACTVCTQTLYSTCDTTDAAVTLDASAQLNWLAIAYS